MRRRWGLAVVLGASAALMSVVIANVVIRWLTADLGTTDPPPSPAPAERPATGPSRIAPAAPLVAEATEAEVLESAALDPDSLFAAQSEVAAALQLVAIRCRLPSWAPTEPAPGRFTAKVENGWYSGIVTALEGQEAILMSSAMGDVTARAFNEYIARRNKVDPSYVVSWRAERWGDTVPCTIGPVGFGTVDFRVVDGAGRPLDGVMVAAGGRVGRSVGGRVTLERVTADIEQGILAFSVSAAGSCEALDQVTVPAGARVERTLAMTCTPIEELDPSKSIIQQAAPMLLGGEAEYEEDPVAELVVFERLRAGARDGSDAAAFYDRLADGSRARIASNAEFEARQQRIAEEERRRIAEGEPFMTSEELKAFR